MSGNENFSNGKQVTNAGNANKSAAESAETAQNAEEMHQAYLQAIFDEIEVEDGDSIEFPYLVRGAQLMCTCGTHKRKLNLPLCHGVYVEGKPLVHEEDCEVGDDKNIPAFGICQSEENPANKSFFEKIGDVIASFFTGKQEEGPEKIMLQTEDGQNVKGYACTPCIRSGWKDVHKTQKIARNGADKSSEGDLLAALTQRSFLVCEYGGLIQPISSGQEEEQ